MLPVRGVPLLRRTIDLFKPHGEVHLYGWAWYEEWINCSCENIHPVNSLLDGILQTKHHWSDRTIFLLGDVLFSRNAVSTIVEKSKTTEKALFFGRPHPNTVSGKRAGELFGFTMMREDWGDFEKKCEFVIDNADVRYTSKLWSLYRVYCGNHLEQHIIDLDWLWVINDYTDDIDSPQAFKQFWPKMILAELEDN